MVKKIISAARKLLTIERTASDAQSAQDTTSANGRRSFFKRTAVGAVSITTTAGLAKTVVDSLPEPNMRDHYIKDSHAGEDELQKREYVVMSEQEKTDMVQTLINHHTNHS